MSIFGPSNKRRHHGENQNLPSKSASKRKKTTPFYLKRIRAELRTGSPLQWGNVIPGRVLSIDLSPKRIRLFINQHLEPGKEVAVFLGAGQRLYLRGTVKWCKVRTLDTSVVATDRFVYRAEVQFLFKNENERIAAEQFIHGFLNKHMKSPLIDS